MLTGHNDCMARLLPHVATFLLCKVGGRQCNRGFERTFPVDAPRRESLTYASPLRQSSANFPVPTAALAVGYAR